MRFDLMSTCRLVTCALVVLTCLGTAPGQKPELITEEGHTSVVRTIAFSPNGKLIASGSEDKKIKLWDVEAGMEFRSMGGNGGTITSIVFADDRTLVSGDDYGTIRVWNTTDGKEAAIREKATCGPSAHCLPKLALSDDRKTIVVVGTGPSIEFLDLSLGQTSTIPAPEVSITVLAFSSPAGLLATAGVNGSITIWNLSEGRGKTLYTSNPQIEISSLAFSPDGKYLASGSQDNYIRVWSMQNSDLVKAWVAHQGGVNCVVYDRAGDRIVSGGNDNTIKVWKGLTGTEALPALKHTNLVRAIASCPSADRIAGGGNDSSVTLWDAGDGHQIKKWEPHTFFVKDVAFSPKGDILATAHWRTIKLWNVGAGRELRTLKKLPGWIYSMAFNHDGSKLASSSSQEVGPQEINVWDVSTGKQILHFTNEFAYSLAFSRDGKLLAGGGYGSNPSIKVWDATDGKLVQGFQITPAKPVRALAFDANGLLISGSDDGKIRVWDPAKADSVRTVAAGIGGILALDISKDSTKLVARGSYQAKIWSLETWQESPVKIPVTAYEGGIRFSPNGNLLAVGEYVLTDKRETMAFINLWRVSNGELLKSMKGHQNGITSVAFSPEGTRIATGSWDNTWRLWSIDSEKELCNIIALDDNEWVAVTPDGRFDASPRGMDMMHWRIGDELITLSQLKQQYWEPGLLPNLLSNKDTNNQTLDTVKLFPKVEYEPPAANSTQLTLKLTSRGGGGIGKVQVKINNTEVFEDARGTAFDTTQSDAKIKIDFTNAPFVRGKPNLIEVITWNAEGYLSSRGETREWIPDGTPDDSPPEFFAVVVGVSEYSDPLIRLKYTAKDAEAMALALELGANRLFAGPGRIPNQGRVHISLLRTSTDPQAPAPTKENIRAAFAAMKAARPQDVVVVYFSGHGLAVNSGPSSPGNGLYCFLTKDARSKDPADYSLPAVIERRTITSMELASWMTTVRALHRVIILDTCAAGAAADFINGKGDDTTKYQVRAVDMLHDRTGFFVLMGSAANSVSYEATRYGQSLLTYSLLERMKIEQPIPESVDIAPLFQYAVDKVRQLAMGTNGIQKPEMIIPVGGASFPIGLLTNDDKREIRTLPAKPIILRPNLLNPGARRDNLQLAAALRKRLDDDNYATATGATFQSDVLYLDADALQGAYSPSGIYNIDGNNVKVEMVLVKGNEELKFEVTGPKDNLDELISRIVEAIYQQVEKSGK